MSLLSHAKGTRADLVVAALTHPGLAHVPVASLRASLCAYLRRCEGEDEFPIDWSNHTMRAFALSFTAERFGITCALCGALRTTRGIRTDLGFIRFVAGDYETACLPMFRAHPLCDTCSPGMWWLYQKDQTPPEDRYATHLCGLYATHFFRERVKTNAAHFNSLRFDPRRLQLACAA